jgi:hypothetical protein
MRPTLQDIARKAFYPVTASGGRNFQKPETNTSKQGIDKTSISLKSRIDVVAFSGLQE